MLGCAWLLFFVWCFNLHQLSVLATPILLLLLLYRID